MEAKLNLNKEMEAELKDTFRRLDDEMRELEELHKEMDFMLFDIERRVARLRRSK